MNNSNLNRDSNLGALPLKLSWFSCQLMFKSPSWDGCHFCHSWDGCHFLSGGSGSNFPRHKLWVCFQLIIWKGFNYHFSLNLFYKNNIQSNDRGTISITVQTKNQPIRSSTGIPLPDAVCTKGRVVWVPVHQSWDQLSIPGFVVKNIWLKVRFSRLSWLR